MSFKKDSNKWLVYETEIETRKGTYSVNNDNNTKKVFYRAPFRLPKAALQSSENEIKTRTENKS